MPLVKAAGSTAESTVERLAFSGAGLMTSGIVGGSAAVLGTVLFPFGAGQVAPIVGLVISILLVGRELSGRPVQLPQLRRQTSARWGKLLPGPVAAGVWGLDIGLGVATYITFSGFWLPLTLALLFESPTMGMSLMASYWLGRALPVWLLPGSIQGPAEVLRLQDAIDAARPMFQQSHMVGLLVGAASLAALALSGAG